MLLAETNWPDVGLEFVKTLAMIATGILAAVAAKRATEAKTEAQDAKTAGQAAATSAGTAATSADEAAMTATTAARMSKAAAVHAADASKRADAGFKTLKTIENQTNGNLEAMRSELIDIRTKYEDLLRATPPEQVVSDMKQLKETTESIADTVKAPKSSTKMKAIKPEDIPPDPPA